ncbi:unnamed protein product [Rangifer tarandus platyrhynchus]|uniref:Uncharacterized protein n=2 Tax=Rangifer tarandus platyrhynchus TaxID=3082113 RepID=A0AC59ZGN9_RANTA|nr:unnamed protein product [Rangifer tarandus platyrhynchus]
MAGGVLFHAIHLKSTSFHPVILPHPPPVASKAHSGKKERVDEASSWQCCEPSKAPSLVCLSAEVGFNMYKHRNVCIYSPFSTCACILSRFSHGRLFTTLWTVARQVPLSIRFSRQEYCSG